MTKDNVLSESTSTKKIAWGAIVGYIALIVQILAGFLFVPLISQHYGQSQYGLITLANSFVSLFMTDIGLSTISNRFLSSYKAQKKDKEIKAVLAIIYKIYLVLAAVLFLIFFVLYFCTDFVFVGLNPGERDSFKEIFIVSSLCSVAVFPMQAFDGVLNAYEEYSIVKLFTLIQKLIYVVFVSLALWLDWPILTIAVINSGSNVLCYSCKYLIVRFKTRCIADFKTKLPKSFLKEIFSYSVWQALASILWRINTYVSSPILGIVSDSTNIAIFGVASEIELYAFSLCNIVTGLFIPKISRIFAIDDPHERQERLYSLSVRTATILSSITLLMVVGFISCGEEFILVWMNDASYSPAYECTILLMIGSAFTNPNVVFNNALYFNGNIKYHALTYVFSSLVFVPFAFTFGYFFGAAGIALSVLLSNIVLLISSSYFYSRRLGVRVFAFYKDVYLKQSVAVIVSLSVGLVLHFLLPFRELINILIIAPCVTLTYFPFAWLISFNRDIRNVFLDFLRRRSRKDTSVQ